ncbi:MAG: bifunctional phosphopantothenoylcysteine decarboxylase/phosphopantothenate--cysteine ligase CoaBC [Xanthomonadaceae bacterium]|nr:bifunctional phosphopantothenoylcysteine decarboxylase/phosphopantothenate--cysteine ligase CoaBC [Xanthomonadaceae bacterium]
MPAFSGERILLGVSGGIAAYKAAELVRRLTEAGAEVRVVMTAGAERFVTPLTFQALSGHPVRSSLWDEAAEAAMGHIELARWATRVLIAPASADVIARLAGGMANDLLTTLCLATAAPVHVAPAMNRLMWANPATAANVATLRQRGASIHGPAEGDQACGEVGPGRMLEPAEIIAALAGGSAPAPLVPGLAGLRLLINAGPTFEDLDPVRFLGNRSSGKMGFALAEQAARAGAKVTLVAGPVALATPPGVQRIDVRSAAQMREAVMREAANQDIFIAAAAVADYTPACVSTDKIKKTDGETLTLVLSRTVDILAEVAAREDRPFVVGFAAETREIEHYACDKLERKKLDMIAANRVGVPGQGFDAESNALTVFWCGGKAELPAASKCDIARELLTLIVQRREQTR